MMIYLFLSLNLVIVLGSFYLLYDLMKPLADLAASTEKWVELLTETAETCRGQVKLMELVEGVSAQLHGNTGSSLRDAINRLEAAAKRKDEVAESLRVGVREDRMKAELDREQLQRMLIELYRLTIKVEAGIATTDRIEIAATGVAKDLSESRARADAVVDRDPGAAADAAVQSDKGDQRENDNG